MVATGHNEDQEIVRSSASELNEYLDSEVLLWRLSNTRSMLTPGSLLLALARTQRTMDEQIVQSRELILSTLYKRRVAWGKKIQKEIPMRVNQWQMLMEDYKDQGRFDGSYAYNVRVRVILSLLLQGVDYVNAEQLTKVQVLDDVLGEMSTGGDFLWDSDLMEIFPQESYPYLYLSVAK